MLPGHPYSILLITVGVLTLLFEVLGRDSAPARAIAAVIGSATTVRYVYWRIAHTMPAHVGLAHRVYAGMFLLLEIAAMGSSMLVYFFMSRTVDRGREADLHAGSPLRSAPTDVFVASYNESRDILERTLVGALALDHPDLRVWLLDDGARPWAEELASSVGALYVSRVKGKHAKAGNINNAMQHALKTGRRPEFLLLLDADFIPHRHLLQRVLGLFDTTDVGIVQTPQHFFNPDPVQSNLLCTAVWPDEQRFFFNSLLPSKDAWGAAFCCGTSAVFRVEAFVRAGGMATETVTEDMLTTYKFEEHGYRTIFLNERLSLGLAPESLVEFLSQRSRWCLGALQQIFTPWNFFGTRLSLINRIAFFDTVLHWCSTAPYKVMLLCAPMLYWLTGITVMHTSGRELVAWAGPMIAANVLFMGYLAENRILPVMTDATQLLTSFVISRTAVSALLRPFGRPFRVTAKGLSTDSITVQWGILWKFALLAGLTLFGLFTHVGRFSPSHGTPGYLLNVVCTLLSAAVMTVAALVCIELPHRRRDERFSTTETATVRAADYDIACRLRDISLGGAAVVRADGGSFSAEDLPRSFELLLGDYVGRSLPVRCSVVQQRDAVLTVAFEKDEATRHALIRKLFTGNYHHDIQRVSMPGIVTGLLRAALG